MAHIQPTLRSVDDGKEYGPFMAKEGMVFTIWERGDETEALWVQKMHDLNVQRCFSRWSMDEGTVPPKENHRQNRLGKQQGEFRKQGAQPG